MGAFAGIIGKRRGVSEGPQVKGMLDVMRHRHEAAPVYVLGSNYSAGYARTNYEERWQTAMGSIDSFDVWCADGTVMPGSRHILASLDPAELSEGSCDLLRSLSGVFALMLLDKKTTGFTSSWTTTA